MNGTVGVGKTTAIECAGQLLRRRAVRHALIDLDWLANCWPGPPDDPFSKNVEWDNLAHMADIYARSDTEVILAAGVVEDAAARTRYEASLGADLCVIRLCLPLPEVNRRLRSRLRDRESELAWHVNRAAELDALLDWTGSSDLSLSVRPTDSGECVARRILECAHLS